MAINYGSFSRDQNTAMSQFRSQYGRNPTSEEIKGWQSYGASSAPSASSTSNLSPGSTQQAQSGYGNKPLWDVLSSQAMGPADVSALPGMNLLSRDQFGDTTAAVSEGLSAYKESIDKLSAANASALKGEIPADVVASVRRAASETAISGGVFGTASRNLSARDLGRTSHDIRQQGMTTESAIAEARQSYSAANENIRQFNATRNAQITELSIKARGQNLSAIDVERQRITTNIEANMNILQMISTMRIQQQNIASSAAASKIDPSNIIASLDSMIAQFSAKLY